MHSELYKKGYKDGFEDARTRAWFYAIFPDQTTANTFPKSNEAEYMKGYRDGEVAFEAAATAIECPQID